MNCCGGVLGEDGGQCVAVNDTPLSSGRCLRSSRTVKGPLVIVYPSIDFVHVVRLTVGGAVY